MGLHQFLDAVIPEDPGVPSLRDGWGGVRHLSVQPEQMAPGLTLSERERSVMLQIIEQVFGYSQVQ